MKTRSTKLLGIVAMVAGLSLCTYGIFQLVRPAQYAAKVTMKVEDNPPDSQGNYSYGGYFPQIAFEIMKSHLVLSNVVTTLNLNEVWGKKRFGGTPLKLGETMDIIKGRLRFALIQNTWLLTITFYDTDPDEAAQIANAVGKAYQDYRVENYRQTTTKSLEILEQQFQAEENQISNLQTNLERRHELDELLETHKMLAKKIQANKVDAAIPMRSMVQITDPAVPPRMPVGPNRIVAVVMIVAGVFLIIAGLQWLKPADDKSTST